ncbi:STAS/SEC14 domain-containing protein [Altererythrobacter sp. BO-6]|uniref:STAS/SEC14 domain-containing protein n=1 Tax=Altererythrobacter sp. BO-6 TaxID=2604537 RepID=UPI0013E1106B|nr:STAS/SEC14 domain-containing protein [Altererythrobacter sp. BO-6]QIG54159.1 STAS/SEC14 domain-containing protein [Altererythrobacter sp. BO-6]
MIEIDRLSENAHRMVVIAEFRQEDAEALVAFAKERNAAGGGGNVLIDVTAVTDFTFSAVAIELAHMPSLVKWVYGLDRIAIVSDNDWVRTGARLESALLPGVVYEVYAEDEADVARVWVLEQSKGPHTGAIKQLDVGRPGITAFELSGRLDREESERGVALVRKLLEDSDSVRLLLVIRNWHGFDLDRLLSREVLSGKLEIARKLDRYAIVGGPEWLRRYAEFTSVFVKAEIKSFPLEEQDKAIEWLAG